MNEDVDKNPPIPAATVDTTESTLIHIDEPVEDVVEVVVDVESVVEVASVVVVVSSAIRFVLFHAKGLCRYCSNPPNNTSYCSGNILGPVEVVI